MRKLTIGSTVVEQLDNSGNYTIAGKLLSGLPADYNGTQGQFNGSVSVTAVGAGYRVAEGANAKQGVATLSSGVAVVSNTSVTANSRIFLTAQDNNSVGILRVSARTAGTSFTITSSILTDSGVIAYQIFEPA